MSSLLPAIAVLGPTGSGKSELALRLAEAFGGEIVNCDSVQLYRHLNIGTAKVPADQRRGIEHHLLDIIDPDQVFTAGDYMRVARPVLHSISNRGKVPIIAGGTGFYYRSLVHGLMPSPPRDEELRRRLGRRTTESLHRLLSRVDSGAAERIHRNDRQKIIRALELCLLARKPVSELHREQRRDRLQEYRVLPIGLDPPAAELAARIDVRCERMFRSGLLQETQTILDRGFAPNCKALESIGYRQAVQMLQGLLSEAEAVRLTQNSTRQYAKRQRTWFRREEGLVKIAGFGNQTETYETANRLADKFVHL